MLNKMYGIYQHFSSNKIKSEMLRINQAEENHWCCLYKYLRLRILADHTFGRWRTGKEGFERGYSISK